MTAPKQRHTPVWAGGVGDGQREGRWGCSCGYEGPMVILTGAGMVLGYSLALAQKAHEDRAARSVTLDEGARLDCGHLVAVGRRAYLDAHANLLGELVCGQCAA